jgi:acyl carrier protein
MTKGRDDRIAEVQGLLQQQLNIEPPEPSVDIIETGLLDSLALVELLFSIEHELGVEIPVDRLELDDLRSISAIAQLIERCEAESTLPAG